MYSSVNESNKIQERQTIHTKSQNRLFEDVIASRNIDPCNNENEMNPAINSDFFTESQEFTQLYESILLSNNNSEHDPDSHDNEPKNDPQDQNTQSGNNELSALSALFIKKVESQKILNDNQNTPPQKTGPLTPVINENRPGNNITCQSATIANYKYGGENQDRILPAMVVPVRSKQANQNSVIISAVFDGNGGAGASELAVRFFQEIAQTGLQEEDLTANGQFSNAFFDKLHAYIDQNKPKGEAQGFDVMPGSTMVLAQVSRLGPEEQKITLYSVGDSRGILSVNGKAVMDTPDMAGKDIKLVETLSLEKKLGLHDISAAQMETQKDTLLQTMQEKIRTLLEDGSMDVFKAVSPIMEKYIDMTGQEKTKRIFELIQRSKEISEGDGVIDPRGRVNHAILTAKDLYATDSFTIGDKTCANTHQPVIRSVNIGKDDTASMILVCDGVTDVLSSKEIAAISDTSAENIAKQAVELKSRDNISVQKLTLWK